MDDYVVNVDESRSRVRGFPAVPVIPGAGDSRSIDEIIIDIRRDLGIAGHPGYHHPWRPRTTEDIAELHARAAGRHPAPRTPARPRLVREPPSLAANDVVAMLLQGGYERSPS